MAFVIPAVAAFAAAGGTVAGVAAAVTGAAGFATFASVAGGFLASAGMLTKNKTLTKIGSVLGLAGAVTNIVGSLASSAGSAAGTAAGEAAGEAAKEGASEALKSEFANTAVGEIGKVGTDTLGTLGSFGDAAAATGGAPALSLDPSGFGGTPNLLDQYRTTAGGIGSFADGAAGAASTAGKLAEAGAQIKDQSALQSVLDKLSNAGKWVKDNKELAMIGGQVLSGGMQSYQRGQEFDEQMNLLEARRRRLNQPVALGAQPLPLPIKTGG